MVLAVHGERREGAAELTASAVGVLVSQPRSAWGCTGNGCSRAGTRAASVVPPRLTRARVCSRGVGVQWEKSYRSGKDGIDVEAYEMELPS